MNILFLTMSQFDSIDIHNIYADLMLTFINTGHRPYIVTPYEKRFGQETELLEFSDHVILKVKVGNMSGVSLIKKGLSTVWLEQNFNAAIKKHLSNVKFDLILYSTPPITLAGVVKKQKARQRALTYLLLKDIFPQNAVDLGMMRNGGLLHRYFRRKEKQLYELSDHIGCMSPTNVDYLLKHNPEIASEKASVSPNSIITKQIAEAENSRREQREKYAIPQKAVVFMYGGNLGKPQDIPFVIECLRKVANKKGCFFVICGSGSEYPLIERYVKEEMPANVLLINGLPKSEYDCLLQACDVGLLFLDHRFTIPNFPSRMLSYMEQSMPILACTDKNTDVGKTIVDGGFGWWCESNDADVFAELVYQITTNEQMLPHMGALAYEYLINNYTAERTYSLIQNSCFGLAPDVQDTAMKDNRKVSVVIPMYNVERYIRACLESVTEQTYDDIEIVLVNDGSTDNSNSIAADVLSKSKTDYQIIQQNNMGVSAARNTGVSTATGKWIVFLDADDVIHRDFIKYLVDSVKTQNSKCVAFSDYSVVDTDNACGFDEKRITKESKIASFNRMKIQKHFLRRKIRIILPAMIISKELLIKNNVKFDEDCRYSEDVQFIWMILGCVDKVQYLDKPIYNYVLRSNSTMTSSNVSKILTGYLGMNKLYDSFINNGPFSALIKRQIKARWVFGALHSSAKMRTYQDFLAIAEKMNFSILCKKLICMGDIRMTLLCIIWRLNKKTCYKLMRRY